MYFVEPAKIRFSKGLCIEEISNNGKEKLEEHKDDVLSRCSFRVYEHIKNKVRYISYLNRKISSIA